MWNGEFKQDQRSVSELYGTVLIISLAFLTALLLVGAGWVVIDQLTSESEDSLAQDSMQTVDQGINNIAGSSVNETTTFEFPEGTGADVSARDSDGVFNLSIRTANETFWKRTVAEGEGLDEVGHDKITLGTITHEAESGEVTAYQGGALWRKPQDSGATFILSEPNLDFTGNSLDLGIVNLTNLNHISEGAEVRATQNAQSQTSEEMQEFMAKYWTDKYNPAVTAPVEINITIESQYADGWATYAEERMSASPEAVLYPFEGDDDKVRIVFGEIGEGMDESFNNTFADDVLYAGASDWAYEHYNATAWPSGTAAHGEIDGDPTDIGITVPSNENHYEVAVYNESGEWIIYNNWQGTSGRWEDADGNEVDPSHTEAIETVEHPDDPSTPAEYHIKAPRDVDAAVTPICVVTNHSMSNPSNTHPPITDYLDEEGEGCLANMVGIDEDLVDPIPGSPDFNVTVTNPGDVPSPELEVGDDFDLEVKVENEGDATGKMPLGVYTINKTNWVGNGSVTGAPEPYFNESFLLGGLPAEDVELDPGESISYTETVEATPAMANDSWEWTAFATTGVDIDVPGDVSTVPSTEFFTVPERDVSFQVEDVTATNAPVEEGESMTVDITVNETEREITTPETQDIRLTAEWPGGDRLVWQEEVTLHDNKTTLTATWETRDGDAGNVTLEASSFDHENTTEAVIEESDVAGAEFEVEIDEVQDDGAVAGEEVGVNVQVANTGDDSGDVFVELTNPDGELVDVIEVEDLEDGEDTEQTLTWDTQPDDAPGGEITVEAGSDDDTDDVELDDPAETDSSFNVSIESTNSPVIGGQTLDVTAQIENTGDEEDTQFVYLTNFDGEQTDFTEVNLSSGESTTVTLSWDTTPADNGTADVTVASEDDDDATEATVEPPGASTSEFEVEIQGSDYGVTAGDPLPVNVTVTNTGDEADTQFIYLQDINGSVVDTVEVGPLDPGDSTTTTVTWDTNVEDGGESGDLTVASTDDTDTAFAEVFDPNTDESEFEVTIEGTNSPVTESENLTVTATIENTGDSSDTQFVVLENFDGGPVDVKEISLNSGEATTTTFTWQTIVGDADEGEVTVVSADDSDSADATIEPKQNELRDPVDVVFTLDESGSMGDPYYDPDESWAWVVDDDPSVGDTYTVPDGELWWTRECNPGGNNCDWIEHYSKGTITVDSDVDRIVATQAGQNNDGLAQRIGATRNAIGALNESLGDQAGAVRYTTDFSGGADTASLMTNDLDSVNESLDRYANGGTPIGEAMYESRDVVLNGPNDEKFVILLSDGRQNAPSDGPVTAADNIDEDITFYTVGFGNANEDAMKYVANNAGNGEGEYFEGDNADELSDIFTDIVDEVTEPDTPTFNVSVVGTNDPVESGNTLEVEAEVTNNGAVAGEGIVSLSDFGGTNVDSATTSNLTVGESETLTLEWDTTGEPPATDEVTVATVDNETTTEVTVEEPDTPASDFQVVVNDVDSPVTEGESMTVEATVFNEGAEDTQQIVLWDFGQNEVVDTVELTLGQDEQDDVTLVWDTEIGDAGSGTITVASADSAGTADAEVLPNDGADSQFAVDIDESASTLDVTEGETVSLVAEITNEGNETDSQQIYLQDYTGAGLLDAAETGDLASGESKEITLTWDAPVGVAPLNESFTVASNDDQDSAVVNVSGTDGVNSDFVVDINESASDTDVIAGGTLSVVAEVTNAGEDFDEQNVVLWDFNKSSVTDIEPVALDGDESQTVTFEWNTDDDDAGTDDIFVESDDDQDSLEVEVKEPDAGETDLQIEGVSYTDPATAGNTVSVDVDVKNIGAANATDEWLSMAFVDETGNTVGSDYQQIDLDYGEQQTFTLEWDTEAGDVGDYDLTVETKDDSETGGLTVEPAGTDLDISIADTNDPITAGETLEVVAEVTNTGSQPETGQILLRDNSTGFEVDYEFDVDVPAGGTEVVTLTWDTRVGDGVNGTKDISAEIANTGKADTESVEIEKAETDLDNPSIGQPGNPLDIDLDEVEIGT